MKLWESISRWTLGDNILVKYLIDTAIKFYSFTSHLKNQTIKFFLHLLIWPPKTHHLRKPAEQIDIVDIYIYIHAHIWVYQPSRLGQ